MQGSHSIYLTEVKDKVKQKSPTLTVSTLREAETTQRQGS